MGDQRPFFPFRSGPAGAPQSSTVPPAAPASAPMTVDTQNIGQPTAAIARRPSRSSSIEIAINLSPPISPTPTEHRVPSQLHSVALSPKKPTSGNMLITIFASPSPSSLPGSPQRVSQPQSPSHPRQDSHMQASNESEQGGQPISPSEDSRTTIQDPTVAAEQGSQVKLGNEGDNADKGQAIEGASFKHDVVEAMSTISSEIATTTNVARDPETTAASPKPESPMARGEHKTLTETDEKPDEVKEVKELVQETNTEAKETNTEAQEVKELVQETNTEANEAKKTEAGDVPKSGNDVDNNKKTEIPKPDQTQKQKQDDPDTKEFSAASFPIVKPAMPQPKKGSTISDVCNKSVPSGGDHPPLQKDIRNYISRFVDRMATRDLKNSVYDKPVSVITLSGKNNGASMQMGLVPSESEGYNTSREQSIDAAPDRDEISAEKRMEDAEATEDQLEAYVNNNAQGINNSIVFDGSITERNPGVHMAVVTPCESTSI